MPSIINATTTAGVSVQGDNSGSLQLATNNGTTAVTIDTSQNVGIGNTSPSHILDVSNTNATNKTFRIGQSSGGATANSTIIISNGGTGDAMLRFDYEGTNTDRARIGVTTSGQNLQFFTAGNNERMRITSGGYLKASNNGSYVGVNDDGHELRGTTGSPIVRVNANNTSYTSPVLSIECTRNTSNNTYYFIQATRVGSADVFRVADSGNATNTNGSYGTISDAKLKENIVDASPKLDKVNQLKVRNYNFIGDELKQIGFVAQEFEQVFPSMVEESADKDVDGNDLGTTTKTIKTTVLIPILVKAIQELNTDLANTKLLLTEVSNKVEAQAVRIAELEGAK